MNAPLEIKHWSALAPGLSNASEWLAWSASPRLPEGPVEAPLAQMPAMQRRRVERVGRLALQVAFDVDAQGDVPDFGSRPMVFASRHGDVVRSVGLLNSLANDEPMSPTQFGLSVHNAIAAQYGIARASRAPYSAISGGVATVEAAMVEVLAFLSDGHSEVLLVVYDEPPPECFERDMDEPVVPFAWAARIGLASAGGFQLAVEACDEVSSAHPYLPAGLGALAFLLGRAPGYQVSDGTRRWRWSQHG